MDAEPRRFPRDFGSQIATRGGLPRDLAARIDAIEGGYPYVPEPRRFPLIGWILLAFLVLVLGVAAVAVWGSR